MAEATREEVTTTIECGFCLRRDEALDRPRQLPCTHVHCIVCLLGFFDENHIVQCPLPACGKVFDVQIDDLPTYDVHRDHVIKSCDVCTSNEVDKQPAVIYCIPCDRMFCTKHQQMHKELNRQHPTMDTDKYLLQHNKQPKICTEHDGQPINVGCKKCLKMICVKCLSGMTSCPDGSAHELMSLDELVVILNLEIDELKAKMIEKEEKLEQLFKFTSKTMSEFEEETKDLVEMIHETRDKQIENLRPKYDKLEEELREVRLRVKNQLALFMEEQVRGRWSNLRNYRLRMEARTAHGHQCDVVDGYKDTRNKLQNLVEDILPSLKVAEVSKLNKRVGGSDVELEIVSSEGFLIDEHLALIPSKPLPHCLQLLQSVQMTSHPLSVGHWRDQTFVGLYGCEIASIDSGYHVNPSFITCNSYPSALEVYNDRLYTLVYGNPWTIYVHDMQGNNVTAWNHTDYPIYSSGLAIVSEQVVVPDRTNKHLRIYSLSGSLIKSIPCPQLSQDWVSLCAVSLCALGTDSVIVSDHCSSQVFRMTISSGEVVWTCKNIVGPGAVTCYGQRYVLVAAQGSSTLRVLDSTTGKIVSELTDNAICGGSGNHVMDMYITGDTLIVANYNTHTVVFYQLLA